MTFQQIAAYIIVAAALICAVLMIWGSVAGSKIGKPACGSCDGCSFRGGVGAPEGRKKCPDNDVCVKCGKAERRE